MRVILERHAFLDGRLLAPGCSVNVPEQVASVMLANGNAKLEEAIWEEAADPKQEGADRPQDGVDPDASGDAVSDQEAPEGQAPESSPEAPEPRKANEKRLGRGLA